VDRADTQVFLCVVWQPTAANCAMDAGMALWDWPGLCSFTKLASTQLFNHFPGITELSGRERLFRNLVRLSRSALVAHGGTRCQVERVRLRKPPVMAS
jgi:hypothetical protein